MALDPVNNEPNFASARVLIFPDGTLTPEGLEAVKRKPDDMAEVLRQQNDRIAELLAQVKKLSEKNKSEREKINIPTPEAADERLRMLALLLDRA